jgi:SNF2 family DNA or RNA helicase
MKFLLSEAIIRKLCGNTSYKKGKAYYEAGKVNIKSYSVDSTVIEADVLGREGFHVTVSHDESGDIHAECTCPTLASVNNYCQHIAAVLICMKHMQKAGSSSKRSSSSLKGELTEEKKELHSGDTSNYPNTSIKDHQLANKMINLFQNKPTSTSGSQLYFETREKLNVEFICRPVFMGNEGYMFGVQMKVGLKQVYIIPRLSDFLNKVYIRELYESSAHFTYNPAIHSFQKEVDAVIQLLINICQDSKAYNQSSNVRSIHNDNIREGSMILISPSYWQNLLQLLLAATAVKIEHKGITYNGIHLSNESIPLEFELEEAKSKARGFQLEIKGLNKIIILQAYGYVFSEGKLIRLPKDDCNRLIEIKQMMDHSDQQQLLISVEQVDNFVKTVVPGLGRLGYVKIAQSVSERLVKTPLKAKLFLDRVNNRLLAGLEFHYGNIVLNPIEESGQELRYNPTLMREGDKEQKIIKAMDDSSFIRTDSGFYLQDEEKEYDFLYHVVPVLEKVAQVYATTAVKNRVVKDYVGPKVKVDVDERTDWLSFRFDIQGIPESEIRKLLTSMRAKDKYYRMRNGSLLSLETKEFLRLDQFFCEVGVSAEDIAREEIRLPLMNGLKLIDTLQEENLVEQGQRLRGLMDDLQNPKELDFVIPDSLTSVLRDYQKVGFQWFKMLAEYRFGGILADDMGLGKTIQSIAFIVSVLHDIQTRKMPALIVCPSSLVYNWASELRKFAPEIKACIVDGNKEKRSTILEDISAVDVVITSYPSLRMDSILYLQQSFHTVFFDEAQAFKNPETRTAKTVRRIQAEYRFALTGTPIENSLEELWSILNVVFPSLLPGRKAFNELTRDVVAKRVSPFILRRLKSDVLEELPEKIESIQSSELSLEQKKLYAAHLAQLKHDALKHLNKGNLKKNKIKILAGLTRLRQLCCHPALFVEGYKGGSAKLDQLMEILEECRITGRRVLIFSQFTKMLDIIGRDLAYQGMSYFYLDGQTPPSERLELCNRFNEGEGSLFLISLKAGGTGLNLTGADTVILYDLWWNPAVEQQAADRAHRMGQKNKVQVIRLVARGSIEEKINELQEKKKNLIGEVIEAGQEDLSTITEQDIMEILMIK